MEFRQLNHWWIEKDGKIFVSASLLAVEFGYDRNHIGLLARQGKVNGLRIEKRWFVERKSLERHKAEIESRKIPKTTSPRKPEQAPSLVLSQITEEENRAGRADFRVSKKHSALKSVLAALLILGVFSSFWAFSSNEELRKQTASLIQNSLPSIKIIQDETGLTFRIKKIEFQKTKKDFENLQATIYAQYLSPIFNPIGTVIVRFFGKEKKTAELEKKIQELKDQFSEAEVRILSNEKILEEKTKEIILVKEKQTITQKEVIKEIGGEKTVIERVTVSQAPTLEKRLLSLEEYLQEGEKRFKNIESSLSYVNERFTYTPTILVPTGGGGNQGVTISNPATTDSQTVKVSSLLDVSGDGEIDGKLTVGKNFTVDTSTFFVNSTNNRVGIGTTSLETAFEVVGTASISGDLTVLGDIAIGTSSTPFQLTVIGSGSFTGQLKATRNPTLAHTGTWPSFTNTNDATFYLNPSAPVADGNIIAYVSGSSPKFVVDAEGDIFGKNLILAGTTTQGTTTTQGDLTVEGNTQLGDAVGDKIKFVGTILPQTLSSFPLLVKASASQTVDVFRIRDSSDNVFLTLDQGTGLIIASSGFNFALGGSTATVSYSRLGTDTTSHSNYISKFNDFLVSGDLEVNSSAQFDSFLQVGTNTLYANPTTGNVGIGITSPTSLLTVQGRGEFQGTASASYLLTGNTLQVGGFASVAYSRFGISATTHGLSATNDLLINGKFEVDGTVYFDGTTNFSGISSASLFYAQPGTAASPSFAFAIDQDTGMFRRAVNALGFSTLGVERLTILSDGNVGIGTTAPGARLEVASAGTAATSYTARFQSSATVGGGGILFDQNSTNSFKIHTVDTSAPSGSLIFSFITKSTGATLDSDILVLEGGSVGVGTSVVETRLQVTGGGLCVGSDANCNTDNNTEGTVYSGATAMTLYDIAENYPTQDMSVGPADIVALDSSNGIFVKKAMLAQGRVLGVISENPAIHLGGFNGAQFKNERQVAVGLSGRIPVKVSLEGGSIQIGDHLSLSSIPGVAKKAGDGEQSIGYALEDYTSETASGTIQFFITHGNLSGFPTKQLNDSIASLSFRIKELEAIMASSSYSEASEGTVFDLSILFNSIVSKFNEMLGIVFENGLVRVANIIVDKITAKEVAAEKLCVGSTCVTEQELKTLLEQNGLQAPQTISPNPTLSESPSPAPSESPAPSPETTPNPEPTPSPSESPTPSPEPTPEPSPESTLEVSPTPTPEPTSELNPESAGE